MQITETHIFLKQLTVRCVMSVFEECGDRGRYLDGNYKIESSISFFCDKFWFSLDATGSQKGKTICLCLPIYPIRSMLQQPLITMTEEEKMLKKRTKDAARKRKDWIAQKQHFPLKHYLIKEKNRVTTSKHDEMRRNMRRGMTEEELTADRKRVAEAKRKQRLRQKIAFFGWDNEKRRDNEQDKSPSSCLDGCSKQGSI